MSKKVKEILSLAREIFEFACHGDYSNGNEAFGSDEGRYLAGIRLKDLEEQLKTFEGICQLLPKSPDNLDGYELKLELAIDDVKKILGRLNDQCVSTHELHSYILKEYAQQICQLFEPEEEEESKVKLPYGVGVGGGANDESKPGTPTIKQVVSEVVERGDWKIDYTEEYLKLDEDRLLAYIKWCLAEASGGYVDGVHAEAIARDIYAKTASIMEVKIKYWREKCWNDTMSAKKSGYDDAQAECDGRMRKLAQGYNQLLECEKGKCRERVERIIKWGIEICHEHLPKWKGQVDLMGGVLSRRECPKCWQALTEKERVK